MQPGTCRALRIQLGVLAVALAAATAGQTQAATLHGDCDDNGTVAIFEVQRCVNIFLAPARLSECPACDQNGDQAVDIAEVQGAGLCFSIPTALGCVMITPQPTVASDTPTPSPTNTLPPSPTDTPEPSLTPTPSSTDTPTATIAVSTPTPTATEGAAECGNGEIEGGETCDDGNLIDGDACPSDCVIRSCVPAGTTTPVNVNFQSTVGLVSITVFLNYPDGTLQIPGTGTNASVGQRVVNRLPGLATFVDRDYGLRGAISGSAVFSNNRIFTVNFDNCESAPPATTGDFSCTVIEAVNQSFQNVPGVTCSVSFP